MFGQYVLFKYICKRERESFTDTRFLWITRLERCLNRVWNLAELTSIGQLTLVLSSFSAWVREYFTYMFLHIRYLLPGMLNSGEKLLYFSTQTHTHTHTHTHIYIHTHTHIYIYIYYWTVWIIFCWFKKMVVFRLHGADVNATLLNYEFNQRTKWTGIGISMGY